MTQVEQIKSRIETLKGNPYYMMGIKDGNSVFQNDIVEQKPANKVESKFKVGDWVVEPREGEPDGLWHIDRIEDGCYWSNKCGCTIEYAGKNFHLWTIQDAEDGDVLVYEGEIFMIKSYALWYKIVYHCCYDGKNLHKHSIYASLKKEDFDKVHPATKEQRDTLEKAMADAGCTFDFEKKELKKIEQNSIEPDDLIEESCQQQANDLIDMVAEKSAWSEEDEEMLNSCIGAVGAADYYTFDDKQEMENWLKSLKDRVQPQSHWKPSDEQLDALNSVWREDSISEYDRDMLIGLYTDLKKLREE